MRLLGFFSLLDSAKSMTRSTRSPTSCFEVRAAEVVAGEAAALAVLVEEALGGDGLELAQIAEPRERGVVPQDAPAAAGDQERDDQRAVVLPEIEVVALQVEEPQLVFAEAVERLVGMGEPFLRERAACSRPAPMAGMTVRPPSFSSRIGAPAASKNVTRPVPRSTRARSLAVASVAVPGVLRDLELGAVATLGRRPQALAREERGSLAYATRTTSAAQTSSFSKPSPTRTRRPSETRWTFREAVPSR